MDRLIWIVSLALLAGIGGCAAPEEPIDVSGKVTLDGNPLAEGEIYFLTVGMPPEILAIKDGEFSGKVKAGQRRVEVYAYRQGELPPTATMQTEAPRENFIPARYNSASELKADVKESGPNQFPFDLKTD